MLFQTILLYGSLLYGSLCIASYASQNGEDAEQKTHAPVRVISDSPQAHDDSASSDSFNQVTEITHETPTDKRTGPIQARNLHQFQLLKDPPFNLNLSDKTILDGCLVYSFDSNRICSTLDRLSALYY